MTIDFHTHAFPDDLAPRAIAAWNGAVPDGAHAVLDGTIGALLRSMDAAGIERSIICSIATAPKQVDSILRWSLGIRSDRIVPFASVHPDCADPAAEVRKIAAAGLPGIKMHALYQGYALDDARMWPFYEAVAEAGLVLQLHSGGDLAFPLEDDRASPRRLAAIHRAFPDMTLVAAHLGGWQWWDDVAEILAGTDVYFETSYTFGVAQEEVIGRIIERHGADRILFGSDSPWCDQATTLSRVRQAFRDPGEQELVLRKNARRLLGL